MTKSLKISQNEKDNAKKFNLYGMKIELKKSIKSSQTRTHWIIGTSPDLVSITLWNGYTRTRASINYLNKLI